MIPSIRPNFSGKLVAVAAVNTLLLGRHGYAALVFVSCIPFLVARYLLCLFPVGVVFLPIKSKFVCPTTNWNFCPLVLRWSSKMGIATYQMYSFSFSAVQCCIFHTPQCVARIVTDLVAAPWLVPRMYFIGHANPGSTWWLLPFLSGAVLLRSPLPHCATYVLFLFVPEIEHHYHPPLQPSTHFCYMSWYV